MNLYYERKEYRKFYKKIGKVYSPALKRWVYFTSKGFNHLIYDSNRKDRSINEQILKLSLLKYVVKAINDSKEIEQIRIIEYKLSKHSHKVKHYSLIYIIDNKHTIRIVIERIENYKYTFLSVMLKDK